MLLLFPGLLHLYLFIYTYQFCFNSPRAYLVYLQKANSMFAIVLLKELHLQKYRQCHDSSTSIELVLCSRETKCSGPHTDVWPLILSL